MQSLPHRLRAVIERIGDPRTLVPRLWALARPPAKAAPKGLARALPEVVARLRADGVSHVVAYGDAGFARAVATAWGDAPTWVSHRAADRDAGAADPRGALDAEAVLVGGRDVKLAYVHLLRLCSGRTHLPRIEWVGQGFEFCFSTLPVPAQATAAEVYLFNHFDDYFGLRDPLLVRVRAEDATQRRESWRLIPPRHSVRLAVDELLPARSGPAVVELYAEHPTLTRGRHHRWRLCADVHFGASFTTLHGAHDEGPDRLSRSRIARALVGEGEVLVTIPNYALRDGVHPQPMPLLRREGERDARVARSTHALDELAFARPSAPHVGYEYMGHGTSFYFGHREENGRPTWYGNHESTIAWDGDAPSLDDERRRVLERVEQRGLVLLPHALPVLADADLELGFSFASATPCVDRYRVTSYDTDGNALGTHALVDPLTGPLWTEPLLDRLDPPPDARPALLVLAPDWRALGKDPQAFNMAGELLLRSRRSGDFDVTELQGCWRNLSELVDEFPHWIHANNGLVSRTRLVGRVVTGRLRTGLLLAYASGDRGLVGDAALRVEVVSPVGRSLSFELALAPFTHRLIWLDEVFPMLAQHLPDGHGALLVTSPNRDVNVQLVTRSDGDAVSLQHLWGY